MLKLTVALLAVAVAGTASAAGWRSLRVDGSSEATFATSMAEFEREMSPARYHVLVLALKDVWDLGTKNAPPEHEYTVGDFLGQVDGLVYEQVVTLVDPTGETAKTRLREAVAVRSPPRSYANLLPGSRAPMGFPDTRRN
jgi:hypothetical protein